MIETFCLIYGQEHGWERKKARDELIRQHESNARQYPLQAMMTLWEELHWRWWEELHATQREFMADMGVDHTTKDDLKFYGMAQNSTGGTKFQFPTTFQLSNPDAYYSTVVLKRVERRYDNAMWDIVNKYHSTTPKQKARARAGEVAKAKPEDGKTKGSPPKAKETKAKTPAKTPKRPKAPVDAGAKAGAATTYPAGARLSSTEASTSTKQSPKHDNKLMCWDHSCHSGCKHGAECRSSHKQIASMSGLHWTVQAQLVKRGGLASQSLIPIDQIDSRVSAMRKQAQADLASKKQPRAAGASEAEEKAE